MILFALRCADGHAFEAWFRDNAAYDHQSGRSLITCPECGSHEVEKAPMAPRLGRSSSTKQEVLPPEQRAETAPTPVAGGDEAAPSPAQLRYALQVLRRHIETHCENVGSRFADEARRIQKGEAEQRGIYGEATPADTEKLLEEGIEVATIPWVPSSDA
jgi:hypothetical protein